MTARQLPEHYLQAPHELHDLLRTEDPVREVWLPKGLKVWLVTGHDEARAALTDPRISKDNSQAHPITAKHSTRKDSDRHYAEQALHEHMLHADPPVHTRLRHRANQAFTPRRVAAMRPRIEEITSGLLDAMHGEVDLIETFAAPLPITVICELLGIPVEDRTAFCSWTNALASPTSAESVAAASKAMADYVGGLVDAKLALPGDDFLSVLALAEESGDRLTRTELVAMAFLLLVAGYQTTANLIANAAHALLRNPDQLELLRAQPSLIADSTEEFLRYEGSVNLATFRYTAEPIELGGVEIPQDELVMVSLLAANRDGRRFDDPHRLDLTRDATGHLAFGHGIHYCLGAALARLELEVALTGLLSRFPNLALADAPRELAYRDSNLVRGLFSLPVRLA